MRCMQYHKDMVPGRKLAVSSRAEGSGFLCDAADTATELFLTKGVPLLAKKSMEAGRYYTSEAMRNPRLQKKEISYGMKKAQPVIENVGHKLLDQLSTKVRPNKRHRTSRADLDGAGLDIHSAIEKLPVLKEGWTLHGHNYTGLYNPLDQQLKYDPETGTITEIYQQPTGPTDAVAMQHDVDYSSWEIQRERESLQA